MPDKNKQKIADLNQIPAVFVCGKFCALFFIQRERDMGFSLPGMHLFYLAEDNLDPEEYERIIYPDFAWPRICEQYDFDDSRHAGFHIISMYEAPSYRNPHEPRPHGPGEKARLKEMVFAGDVIMLSEMSGPATLFYVNEQGALMCNSPYAFSLKGAEKIIGEYNRSVSRRDYRQTDGKPRPTVRHSRKSTVPEQQAQATRKNLPLGHALTALLRKNGGRSR